MIKYILILISLILFIAVFFQKNMQSNDIVDKEASKRNHLELHKHLFNVDNSNKKETESSNHSSITIETADTINSVVINTKMRQQDIKILGEAFKYISYEEIKSTSDISEQVKENHIADKVYYDMTIMHLPIVKVTQNRMRKMIEENVTLHLNK